MNEKELLPETRPKAEKYSGFSAGNQMPQESGKHSLQGSAPLGCRAGATPRVGVKVNKPRPAGALLLSTFIHEGMRQRKVKQLAARKERGGALNPGSLSPTMRSLRVWYSTTFAPKKKMLMIPLLPLSHLLVSVKALGLSCLRHSSP